MMTLHMGRVIIVYIVFRDFDKIIAKLSELQKIEFCRTLYCDETAVEQVCGIRKVNGKNVYKLFDNECLLLKYGCEVDKDHAYGIISKLHCNDYSIQQYNRKNCPNCELEKKETVCGIRNDGDGFKVRIFFNKCELEKYNCEKNLKFRVTGIIFCLYRRTNLIPNEERTTELPKNNSTILENLITNVTQEMDTTFTESTDTAEENISTAQTDVYKNIIVVHGSKLDLLNVNKTIADFFAATHDIKIPIRDSQANLSDSTRRRLIRIFGPIKVFTPWLEKPKVVHSDFMHEPTLSSCYHKCPTKCPDTYAPVCGSPGMTAREPALMFQNHCFMDVAQCKVHWEEKSETAFSAAYLEASFVFCLGQELSGLYRFLPLIRTLQHMGRLKKKGKFIYKFKNMKFYNEYLHKQPKPMG